MIGSRMQNPRIHLANVAGKIIHEIPARLRDPFGTAISAIETFDDEVKAHEYVLGMSRLISCPKAVLEALDSAAIDTVLPVHG